MTPAEAPATGTQLLTTKLHAPRRRREAVRRSRLNKRLIPAAPAGADPRLGSGRVWEVDTADRVFADSGGSSVTTAWLALDAGDNDPAIFGSYLVAALQSLSPHVGPTLSGSFDRPNRCRR